MHFLSTELEKYIEEHSQAEPQLLQELSRETHLKIVQPRMITGHFQGRVISMLSKLIRPNNILEIGTFTGYATLCLAEGLRDKGKIHTIEINEELSVIQNKYFSKSNYAGSIVTHIGDALDVIPRLKTNFDLVFIDGKKIMYDAYFEAAIKKVKPGSIILSDNVLWSGKVISPVKPNDKATEALIAFNSKLNKDPRVESIIFPIRDGITLSRVL
jgi:predicted O-methyltransferase YrrM